MSVVIDDNAGFCFGVVKAIAAAEEQLRRNHGLYCLGDIVHNNEEVHRLSQLGLHVIGHDEMASMSGGTVLIRAHGEPPSTYNMAESRGITLVDATCPIVLALQKKIRDGYESMRNVDGQVVIFGKQGHAEVVGLNGQTMNTAIIVSSSDDIKAIDFSRPIRLYSQTTKSKEEYKRLIQNISDKVRERWGGELAEDFFVAYNTICSRVANRVMQLEQFARGVDTLIFVSGANSSNGHYLFECCRRVQPNSHMISSIEELDSGWFVSARQIGITGATSTPRWLMEQIRQAIESVINKPIDQCI